MSAAVCPACGVAVMPGYARCPKCRRPLPRRVPAVVKGGTAVEEKRRWPLFAVLGVAVAAAALIIVIGRGGNDTPTAAPVAQPVEEASDPIEVAQNPAPFEDRSPTPQPTGPDPTAAAASLERDLKRQRLWSNVTVSGTRVDVRSGSCGDPAMGPTLDGAAASLRAAGLTKLRCVEQSGRVVTDRDL